MKHLYIFLVWNIFWLLSCTSPPPRVLLTVEQNKRWVTVEKDATVADVLAEANVQLGLLDRVEPPSYTLVEPDMSVRVIRIRERKTSEEQPISFPREVRRDASLPPEESRLIQLGQNGRTLVTYQITLEDGVEIKREPFEYETLLEPVAEILVVGTRGEGKAIKFEGTIVYLEQGNAWLMRGDSTQKRALTRLGDLDGHVFSLSPDGRWLLFTRQPLGGASGQGGPLNTLWLVDTLITNETPRPLQIDSVLWADWQPCSDNDLKRERCPLNVAFSSAERLPTPPGWQAYNDLHLFTLDKRGKREKIEPILPKSNALLGWWGREWQWSPDGNWIAWGNATQIGYVNTTTNRERKLVTFVPFESHQAWVWTPQLSWAPDSRSFLATVHHTGNTPPNSPQDAEESTRFDLLQIDLRGEKIETLVTEVGPFAMPHWLEQKHFIYGQAEDKTQPLTSRYRLMLQEQNKAPLLLFPPSDRPGVDVPWIAWNPLNEAIIGVWQGDLYLIPLDITQAAQPLTLEGSASHPQWGR